jgi:hypothetical protein
MYLGIFEKTGRCVGFVVVGRRFHHGLCLEGDLKPIVQAPPRTRESKGHVCYARSERLKHHHREVWSYELTKTYKATGRQHQCPERLQRPFHPASQMDIDSQESMLGNEDTSCMTIRADSRMWLFYTTGM